MSKYDPPIICADDGEDCACFGTLVYGKKFANGIPGDGKEMTCEQTMEGTYKMTNVTGSMKCIKSLLGDPAPGLYKHCCCVDVGLKKKTVDDT